ncbi:MAG: amidohydrolase family protein [Longimicrobiales bacterium]
MTLLVAALALAPAPAPALAQTIAITNARIYSVAGPMIERGTVIISDGRIAAVGADAQPPAGAQVIDAAGKVVTPGFIDSFTQLGVVEIGAAPGTVDVASREDRITAAFNVVWGINPASTLIPIARTGGITRAVVAPNPGASIIAGQGALIQLAGGRADEMVMRNPIAMFAILDEGAAERTGGARGVAMLRLREIFQDARDYAANRAAYDAGSRREYAASRLDLAALDPVLDGALPLVLGVDRASDILNALGLARDFGLQLVLSGAREGWLVADDIARAGVPVIVNPMSNLPDFDALSATLENAARLANAGVTVVFASFDAHNTRNLRQAAGNAVAYGMPFDAALRAVTLAPAQLWGVADQVGTLEVGRQADVVVWSGDPFELLTHVEHVFIGGREAPDDTRQRMLLERYRTLDGAWPPSFRH